MKWKKDRKEKKKSKKKSDQIIRIEELEEIIEKYGDDVDPETIVSMFRTDSQNVWEPHCFEWINSIWSC